MRRLSTSFLAAAFLCACASTGTDYSRPAAPLPDLREAPPEFARLRVVLPGFRNSAGLRAFEIVPDGEYGDRVITPGSSVPSKQDLAPDQQETDGVASTEDAAGAAQGAPTDPAAEPPAVSPADVAREVTETAFFQSGYFEIVPVFQYTTERDRLRAEGLSLADSTLQAARNLGIDYICYGDLTNFEIGQNTSYWKVPFWAIVLVGSFFIKDDDVRVFIWYSLLRALAAIPLDSQFWRAGVGWEDLELRISIAMNLRLVDVQNGSVVFSRERDLDRIEKARNLDLLFWVSDSEVRITRSSAGHQIRYVAQQLTNDLGAELDTRRDAFPGGSATSSSGVSAPLEAHLSD